MLTGATFSGLNAWNPASGDFLMTFSGHLGSPGISFVLTYLTLYDQTLNNGVSMFIPLSSDTTSLWLDSNLFSAGHEYHGNLQFFHQYSDPSAPHFGSIKAMNTSFEFTTTTVLPVSSVPDSPISGALALTLFGMLALHRRSSSTKRVSAHA
jgi:MYXO-CTERM domain-containing protein